jgi:hypothetical protein
MDVSTIANLINALAVTAGVIFAAVQIRDYRRQRHRDSMSALVRSFQTPAFAHALRRVSSLPDNVAPEQIPALLGSDGEDYAYALLTSWEALGILLYRKELTIDLIDDSLAVQSWFRGESSQGMCRRCAPERSETPISNGSNGSQSE